MPLDDSTDSNTSRPGAPKSPLGEDARQPAAHLGQTARVDLPDIPPVIGAAGTDDGDVDAELERQTALAMQKAKERRAKRRRKRLVKVGVAVGIVAVIAGGIAISRQLAAQGAQQATPITAPVTKQDFSSTVSASGKAQPLSSTIVTPEVDGIIEDVQVKEGSVVSEGDVLFTLKNDSLDKAVREASQQVRSAQNGVNSAQTTLDNAWDSYNKALDAWNSAPDAETQKGMTHPDQVYAEVESAQSSLEGARISLEGANDAYNEAVANTSKRTVKAPCSGSVVAVNAVAGASAGGAAGGTGQAGSGPLVQIADVSQMTVTAQVNEVDISKLAVGQKASVSFSALPELNMEGEVTRIATVSTGSGDSGRSGYGVVTYSVEVLIPSPDPSLKPGMTANATITTQSIPNALTVPATALTPGEGDTCTVEVVKLSDDGSSIASSEKREVKVVAQNSSDAVVEGLKEGELVLLGTSGGSSDDDSGAMAGAGIMY